MADDGLVLNFEVSDTPLKSQVKFKGGRWRDRVRAQNSAKREHENPDETAAARSKEGQSASSRFVPRQRGDDDSQRPAKRQRVGPDDSAEAGRRNIGSRTKAPGTGAPRSGQVTSRLFTANPEAKTVFEEPEAEDAEPAKPSNAPLSEEAENFLALGLSRRVAQHLSTKLGMKAPTAIQKNTIPQLVKEDNDAFLQAETGSGKTLAYLLPIVHRLLALSQNEDSTSKSVQIHRDSGLFAIILAPTRELCKQIAVVLEKVLRCAPWLVSTTVIGGESKKSEKARLRKGVNILIATPGRLTDHLDNTKVLDVGTVRWLVLDEGDRMMEMGFEDDIKTIVGKIRQDPLSKSNKEGVVLDGILPSRRVTVLCSATMKMNVQKLGEISLTDAIHITASRPDEDASAVAGADDSVFTAPAQLKQSYLIVPAKLRLVTLISFLKSTFARRGSVMKAIIFISCADSVNFHFDLLKSEDPKDMKSSDVTVAAAAYITSPANPLVTLHRLHGSLPQPVRTSTLQSFTTCKDPCVLITTDISSRGLDVPAVDLVIEYDPAFAIPDHVHRIGRTARAGRAGKAALFLQPGCEEGYLSLLKSTSPLAPQPYDPVLQKGLSTPIDLPKSAAPTSADEDATSSEKTSYKSRAEALQLHLEQRLLAPPPGAVAAADDALSSSKPGGGSAYSNGKSPKKGSGGRGGAWPQPQRSSALLEAARTAFRSHIRAYATHVRDERGVFDITQLHLGHVAKSFGLREAPGGIGGGVSRRAHKGSGAKGGAGGGSSAARAGGGAGSRGGADSDDEGHGRAGAGLGVDEDAARRMREKMRAVAAGGASEFNIG